MPNSFTEKDLEVISYILMNESLCAKKARVYSNTLMDSTLSEVMSDIAACHEQRFNQVYSLIANK